MGYRNYVKITAIVILLTFLMTPVFGEQPTGGLSNSGRGGMKYYSEGEVREIVEELSEAAEEAIEQAAAEAAKAEALASLEREASLLQAKALAVREAQHWQGEYRDAKKAGIKTAVITGVICFFGGLALGAGTVVIIGGR
jgi:hypothetical protein